MDAPQKLVRWGGWHRCTATLSLLLLPSCGALARGIGDVALRVGMITLEATTDIAVEVAEGAVDLGVGLALETMNASPAATGALTPPEVAIARAALGR